MVPDTSGLPINVLWVRKKRRIHKPSENGWAINILTKLYFVGSGPDNVRAGIS